MTQPCHGCNPCSIHGWGVLKKFYVPKKHSRGLIAKIDYDFCVKWIYITTRKDLKPKLCLRCNSSNPVTNVVCGTCGLSLDKKQAETLIINETQKEDMDNFMNKLVNNKEILKILVEKMVEMKINK